MAAVEDDHNERRGDDDAGEPGDTDDDPGADRDLAGHDETVAYANVVVPGGSVDLRAWECWNHHGRGVVHYYAQGPCPGCGALSQGHVSTSPAPIESQGVESPSRRQLPLGEPIEVPVHCTCGSSHGHDGAQGCGRGWSILCPPAP